MKNTTIGLILGVFIIILIGVNLLSETADTIEALDDVDLIRNESFTWITNVAVSLANDDWVTTYTPIVINQTTNATINAGNYTVDYENGTITLTANYENNTAHSVSYQHYPDTYLTSAVSVTLIKLCILFFALGLVVYAYIRLKDTWEGFY